MYLPNFLDGFDRLVAFDTEMTGKRSYGNVVLSCGAGNLVDLRGLPGGAEGIPRTGWDCGHFSHPGNPPRFAGTAWWWTQSLKTGLGRGSSLLTGKEQGICKKFAPRVGFCLKSPCEINGL
jgi:hypothetical protein